MCVCVCVFVCLFVCLCVYVCMSMHRVFHLEQSLLIYLSNPIQCTVTICIIQGVFLFFYVGTACCKVDDIIAA